MVPGMINFMMFGVELKDSGEPLNKFVWSKPQIDNPIWAYGQPYSNVGSHTYFLNSIDSKLTTFQILLLKNETSVIEVEDIGGFTLQL